MVLAAATFIAGLGITWIVWQAEKRDIDLRARTRFEFTVEEITSAITARMGTYEQVLRGGASLINTLGGATRAQWRDYVGHLSTISAYLALPDPIRAVVLDRIFRVLPEQVTLIADLTLHLARKA